MFRALRLEHTKSDPHSSSPLQLPSHLWHGSSTVQSLTFLSKGIASNGTTGGVGFVEIVGDLEGITDGRRDEGTAVGITDGRFVEGTFVGVDDCIIDGALDGVAVGRKVGAEVVGVVDGNDEGCIVVFFVVGAGDGSSVSTIPGKTHRAKERPVSDVNGHVGSSHETTHFSPG